MGDVSRKMHITPVKMGQTECSETSAQKVQTTGDHPKKNTTFRTWRKFEIKVIFVLPRLAKNFITIVLLHFTLLEPPHHNGYVPAACKVQIIFTHVEVSLTMTTSDRITPTKGF